MKPGKAAPKRRSKPIEVDLDPELSARAAGLRYVSDTSAGISRRRYRTTFRYFGPDGKLVNDQDVLRRIKSLVIPPAWSDVWICPISNGHLQATGRDARGRKQSRYHPRWRDTRDETKYERMLQFGRVLPGIRKRVDDDLALSGLPKNKVIATVVRLLETTGIRIGNEEYATKNKSYGLTTMRTRHVGVRRSTITFTFAGKSGVHHTIDTQNRRLANIVKRCLDLPGYELFQYLDETGARHSIDSADVNEYLQQVSGQAFTAKDFRTWSGTVLTASLLRRLEPFESETQAKKNVVETIKAVAARLGNTPSVCRKCYVHPAILEYYFGGKMASEITREADLSMENLRPEESQVLKLLACS